MARGAPTAGATHQTFESPRRGAEHFYLLRATHGGAPPCRRLKDFGRHSSGSQRVIA